MESEPSKGQTNFYLESSQTGRSLFVREDQADSVKQRMQNIIQGLFSNLIDRSELCIFKGEFCWNLHVDLLVFDELSMEQLDYIGIVLRGAFKDLQLPQTIATVNNNTGKIEVGLVEEVYADKENTDQMITIKSSPPYLVSIGVVRDSACDDMLIILDPDQTELQCIDQTIHLAVDSKLKIHAMIQSKGEGSEEQDCVPGIPANLFLAANLRNVIKDRVQQLESVF